MAKKPNNPEQALKRRPVMQLTANHFLLADAGVTSFELALAPECQVQLRVDYEMEEPVPERGIICIFGFDEDPDPGALAGTGISFSEKVGAYRYIPTTGPIGSTRIQVTMPRIPILRTLGLRRWQNAGRTLIERLWVRSSSQSA